MSRIVACLAALFATLAISPATGSTVTAAPSSPSTTPIHVSMMDEPHCC